MKNVYLDSGDGFQGSCQTCPHIADKGCPLHSATILACSRSLRKLKKNKGALQPLQKVMYSSILNSPYFSSGGNIRCPGCAILLLYLLLDNVELVQNVHEIFSTGL